MRAILVIAPLLLVAASARAETLYVDHQIGAACATYDPAARACDGGTARAFPTIQGSFAALAPGDVVLVRGGTYTEEQAYGPYPPSGTADAPIVFRGADGEDVHIQGDVDPHTSSGVGAPFRLYDVDHVTIEGMEISGFFQAVVVGGGDSTRSGPADHVTLRDLFLHDNGLGIYVREGSAHLAIHDVEAVANFLLGDGGAGLMVRDGRDILVERMIARDNDDGRGIDGDADGFHVEPGVRVTFLDCVARDNAEDGYDLTGDEIRIERSVAEGSGAVGFKLWDEHGEEHAEVYRYLVINSIARTSGEAGLFAANGPHIEIYSSVVYGNGAEGLRFTRGLESFPETEAPTAVMENVIVAANGRWGRRFGDGGSTDEEGWLFTSDHNVFFGNAFEEAWPGEGASTRGDDPRFVDAEGGDFRLMEDSPAIDRGVDKSAIFTTDFDGVTRPIGAGWDIGAFEHGEPVPDAGVSADAGPSADAGATDVDAGRGPRDAAVARDGGGADGGESGPEDGGCSCSTVGARRSGAPIALLALLAGIAPRRRIRTRRRATRAHSVISA